MGNPFAPRPHRPKAPPVDRRRFPHARLRKAGAPATVIAEVERRWEGASPAERERALEAFEATTDAELVGQVLEMEFALAAAAAGIELGPDYEDDLDAIAMVDAAVEANAGTVEAARRWVDEATEAGERTSRALAMLVAERRRAEPDQRRTLLEPTQAEVRAGDR